jgi:hypothetical protein
MKKIYCEHGAMTDEVKKLGRSGKAALVHFPYDRDSNLHVRVATPSAAKVRDLNLPIKDLPGTIADYSGSIHFEKILSIVGSNSRVDALHIDSAFKHGCSVFITRDRQGILSNRGKLESLLRIKFLHPDELGELEQVITDPEMASD